MKADNVFKHAYNAMIEILDGLDPGQPLPSENRLGERLGVSRTTVRKVLAGLAEGGYVTGDGRDRLAGTKVPPGARYPQTETVPTSAQVEKLFMEWILRGDTKPGALINELELARTFGVGTTGIREFLNQFRRFGLIEKRP
ncbi:MAG: GntR family transcriptional regulator, partial [Devosia sp.]